MDKTYWEKKTKLLADLKFYRRRVLILSSILVVLIVMHIITHIVSPTYKVSQFNWFAIIFIFIADAIFKIVCEIISEEIDELEEKYGRKTNKDTKQN